MPNVSELAREEEEKILDDIESFKEVARSPNCPRDIREVCLKSARLLEERLGIKSIPYNDERF